MTDHTVENLLARLADPKDEVRALAADECTDPLSPWGQHGLTDNQANRVVRALVDALEGETDQQAREAIVNALAEYVVADLAPKETVRRAIGLPRNASDPSAQYWRDIEAWARHTGLHG